MSGGTGGGGGGDDSAAAAAPGGDEDEGLALEFLAYLCVRLGGAAPAFGHFPLLVGADGGADLTAWNGEQRTVGLEHIGDIGDGEAKNGAHRRGRSYASRRMIATS